MLRQPIVFPIRNASQRGRRFRYSAFVLIALAVCTLPVLSGCGDGANANYDDYESLDLRERLVEVPLGQFAIPVPVASTSDETGVVRNNRLQLKFSLFALVQPQFENDAIRLAERRRGQLRDSVIRVCRNSSLDDLLDPQLSTLKSRILDATQPLMESITLRRMLITQRRTEPL